MKHSHNLVAILAMYLSTSGAAHAIFSTQVPEPETAALLVAGVLVAGGVRYLTKRKKDRRRDE